MTDIVEAVRRIKSPAFIFSEEEFRSRAEETAEILGREIDLCYSIKANPFLLKFLPEVFRRVEVCSPGELEICIAREIPPEAIIYSGLNKGEADIARALDYGAAIITAESELHLKLIEKCAASIGRKVDVLIRIAAKSQFGIDRELASRILAEREGFRWIEFKGLHFFTGTQKRRPKEIIKEVEFLKKYIDELAEAADYRPDMIEYGTGCPAYLFCEKEITGFSDAKAAELAFLEEIAPSLKELAGRIDLSVEMGRFFAASCGHYCTEVVDVKTNDGVDYAVIDGGSHQVRFYGQMQGMQAPFLTHVPMAGSCDDDRAWTIAGSLCTTADVLARNIEMKGLDIGDRIIFHQAGAYALYEGMSLFLSRDIPAIYLLDGDGELKLDREQADTHVFNGG